MNSNGRKHPSPKVSSTSTLDDPCGATQVAFISEMTVAATTVGTESRLNTHVIGAWNPFPSIVTSVFPVVGPETGETLVSSIRRTRTFPESCVTFEAVSGKCSPVPSTPSAPPSLIIPTVSTFPSPAGTTHVAVSSSLPSPCVTRLTIVAFTGSAKAVDDSELA